MNIAASSSMANLPRNRISIDAAADSSFVDSPSFDDLVCIQDQKSKSASANQIDKHDIQFKFTHNKSSQDPNTQLQLQDLICQAKQSETKNQPCYKQNQKVRNQGKKERSGKSSFGQKLFQSVVSPCRQCRAHQPTIKDHTTQPKKL